VPGTQWLIQTNQLADDETAGGFMMGE